MSLLLLEIKPDQKSEEDKDGNEKKNPCNNLSDLSPRHQGLLILVDL
jgi:hypothetical protein